ncbi:hypothetical protein [Acanthopleuribacter pedis]|uniref:Type 4 fimbrial biogenesis protein PilX N-terminal domain-containing protein n=1 Tax=Acanthopleuribacter pedis TaxID=442870 RepID=A0A8J7QM37_9BACT|nr:hypothetical protein [Acanthopleuribacter pedis]MBO1320858.1 hypothetical protein [Acanthopleuribacter pedis]
MNTSNGKERGSTLVIAMMCVLLFLALAGSLLYQGSSQSAMTGAMKFSQMESFAARSAILRHKADLANEYVSPSEFETGFARFTPLLESLTEFHPEGYGGLFTSNTFTTNSGESNYTYDVFVTNNPDDLAVIANGQTPFTPNVDTDSRIVMTTIVYDANDTGKTSPLAIESALVGPTGFTDLERATDGTGEAGSTGDNSGNFQGDIEGNEVSIEAPVSP